MSTADIVLIIILAVCVGLALLFTFRKKKNGSFGCTGDCSACQGCAFPQSCDKTK